MLISFRVGATSRWPPALKFPLPSPNSNVTPGRSCSQSTLPVAIQVDHGVGACLAGGNARLTEAQPARRRFIDPPFAAAVLPCDLQVELAVAVDVGSHM